MILHLHPMGSAAQVLELKVARAAGESWAVANVELWPPAHSRAQGLGSLRLTVPLKQIEYGLYEDLIMVLVKSIVYLLQGDCRAQGLGGRMPLFLQDSNMRILAWSTLMKEARM